MQTADNLAPLYDAVAGTKRTLECGPTLEVAFKIIKTALTKAATLARPYPTRLS